MKQISLKSYAKINLSLDVLGLLDNGYHEVSMIMQQVQLHDDVSVKWYDEQEICDYDSESTRKEACGRHGSPGRNERCGGHKNFDKKKASENNSAGTGIEIEVSTNRRYLPTDERNIAYKAARLMVQRYGDCIGSNTAGCGAAENKENDSAGLCMAAGNKENKPAAECVTAEDKENKSAAGCGAARRGKIRIDIKKVIPVAAGLAGGSGNAAAVLHALNRLWGLGLSLDRLCGLGAELGADVPFCVIGQAYGNAKLGFLPPPAAGHFVQIGQPAAGRSPQVNTPAASLSKASDLPNTAGQSSPDKYIPSALSPASCALAYGTGTHLAPLKPLNAWIVLSKPPVSVSTAEIYKAFDSLTPEEIGKRPENEKLAEALNSKKTKRLAKNMANVLEKAAAKRYPLIIETKDKLRKACTGAVMMSGSGPTVFAILSNKSEAETVYEQMKKLNRETYLTHTLI